MIGNIKESVKHLKIVIDLCLLDNNLGNKLCMIGDQTLYIKKMKKKGKKVLNGAG